MHIGEMRCCTKCHRDLPLARFSIRDNKRGYIGPDSRCKDCIREYNRAYRARNRERARAHQRRYGLKRYAGITVEDYERFFDAQAGACAICGDVPRRRLHADHDHATGRFRGLLCDRCNLGLGHFRDDVALLKQAIGYLGGGRTLNIGEIQHEVILIPEDAPISIPEPEREPEQEPVSVPA